MTRMDPEEAAIRDRLRGRWLDRHELFEVEGNRGPSESEMGVRYAWWKEGDRVGVYTTARMFDGMFWSVAYIRDAWGTFRLVRDDVSYHGLRRDAKAAAHVFVYGYKP